MHGSRGTSFAVAGPQYRARQYVHEQISSPHGRDHESSLSSRCQHIGGTFIGPRRGAAPGRAVRFFSSSSRSAWGCRCWRRPVSSCSSRSLLILVSRYAPTPTATAFLPEQVEQRHRLAGRSRSRRRRWRWRQQDAGAASPGRAAGQGQAHGSGREAAGDRAAEAAGAGAESGGAADHSGEVAGAMRRIRRRASSIPVRRSRRRPRERAVVAVRARALVPASGRAPDRALDRDRVAAPAAGSISRVTA